MVVCETIGGPPQAYIWRLVSGCMLLRTLCKQRIEFINESTAAGLIVKMLTSVD
jgi:hypothetical protein